jgi:hypothetical protein
VCGFGDCGEAQGRFRTVPRTCPRFSAEGIQDSAVHGWRDASHPGLAQGLPTIHQQIRLMTATGPFLDPFARPCTFSTPGDNEQRNPKALLNARVSMLRIGVAIYLTLVTAAGPWPCCCTVTRLVSIPSPQHQGEPAAPSSCCHPQKAPGAEPCPSPGDTRHDPSGHPRRDPCPCQCRLFGAEVPRTGVSDGPWPPPLGVPIGSCSRSRATRSSGSSLQPITCSGRSWG